MPVITIRDNNGQGLEVRKLIEYITEATGIEAVSLKKSQKGYGAHVRNEDKPKLLNPDNRHKLLLKGVEVIKPPDYRAACTFVIRDGIQLHVDLGGDKLKKEMEKAINAKVINMTIFGDKLRIELNSPEDAKRVMDKGAINIESYYIPESDISLQRYVKVPQCTLCYSYAHERLDCPTNEQLCFICAEPGHDDVSCPNRDTPKCRNCHQDHVAIAFKCPFRKVRLYELDERADIDFETRLLVERMRRFHGERGPAWSDDESSEDNDENAPTGQRSTAAASDTELEGAVALDTSPEGSTGSQRRMNVLSDAMRTLIETLVNHYSHQSDDDEEPGPGSMGNKPSNPGEESWTLTRVLAPPDPKKGEGPRRRCRKIENFKAPVEKSTGIMVAFPELPPRPLRRIPTSA